MKTLAVLAALAAVATAVPALPGYGYGYRPAQYRLPASYRREKKSPQIDAEFAPPVEVAPTELETIPEVSPKFRTIFKKPIIVKKKLGYHLYRDSDEEQAQADSKEKCTKEVKVKLCDAEHLMRAAEDSSEPITENDMKHSIKMAKEAVENLQKMTQFQNARMGPDAELHGDIEVARQALEHIQKNFGNLEAMNSQVEPLSDAEALDKARSIIVTPDHERMMQWKEAIENIQKNAEIAKNIEDSFKSDNSSPLKEIETENKMKNAEPVTIAEQTPQMEKSNDEKLDHETPILKNVEEKDVPDMSTAASEHDVVKSAIEDVPLNAKEATLKIEDMKVETKPVEKTIPSESLKQGKSSENDESLQAPLTPLMEKSAEIKDDSKPLSSEKAKQALEPMEVIMDLDPAQSAPIEMNALPTLFDNDAQRAASSLEKDPQSQVPQGENSLSHAQDKVMLAKSNENVPEADDKTTLKIENEKAAVTDTTKLMKNAEPNQKPEENLKDLTGKSSELIADEHPIIPDHISQMKSANLVALNDPMLPNQLQMEPVNEEVSAMRAAEPKIMQSTPEANVQAQGKNWHVDNLSPKAGEFQDFAREPSFDHSMELHHHQHLPIHHHHHIPHDHFHGHINPHLLHGHNHGFHGKAAEDSMVQATSPVNVNAGKSAMEHNNMQWKQKELARGAYGGAYGAAAGGALNLGAEASSGPGAVGVFPGANVGGCAIPLLLSCSPSVVSGSLAKPASYGAGHAYRASENFDRFHAKRDTKINKNIPSTKVKRTPQVHPNKAIQKIPLEKKL